jgi:hypothetical protein
MRALVPLLFVALPAVAAGTTASGGNVTTLHADVDVDDDEVLDGDWHYPCDGTDPALLHEIDEAFRTRIGYGETWDESICNQGTLVGGGTTAFRRRARVAPPTTPAAGSATSTTGVGSSAPALAGAASTASPAPAQASTAQASTDTNGGATPTSATSAAATTANGAKPNAAPAKELTPWEKRVNDQFFALAIPMMAGIAGIFAIVVAALIGLFLRLRRQVVLDVGCPSCAMRFPFVVGESPQLFCPACGAPCRVDVTSTDGVAGAHAVPL